jgi:hypothetical protein
MLPCSKITQMDFFNMRRNDLNGMIKRPQAREYVTQNKVGNFDFSRYRHG